MIRLKQVNICFITLILLIYQVGIRISIHYCNHLHLENEHCCGDINSDGQRKILFLNHFQNNNGDICSTAQNGNNEAKKDCSCCTETDKLLKITDWYNFQPLQDQFYNNSFFIKIHLQTYKEIFKDSFLPPLSQQWKNKLPSEAGSKNFLKYSHFLLFYA